MSDGNGSGLIEKIALIIGSILSTIAGSKVWVYVANRRKTAAQTRQISTASDVSVLDAANEAAKDSIALYREVTVELRQAGLEIRELRKNLRQVERLFLSAVHKMKMAGTEGWQKLEEEAEMFLRGDLSL